MDQKLVYVKTPIGDEAVRQSTRVVERNLRMVLVQVDGKLSIAELAAKIGNVQLVEDALHKLEKRGFIAPSLEAISVWEETKRQAGNDQLSTLSEFSTFGPKPVSPFNASGAASIAGSFSSFGKPILPSSRNFLSKVVASKQNAELGLSREREIRILPWIKWGSVGIVVLFCCLLGLAFRYPYARLIPAFEASMADFLQTPVRVGGIAFRFSPWPNLVLSDVKVGESFDSHVEAIRIGSPLLLLKGAPYRISTLEVVGADFSANQVVALPFFNAASGRHGERVSVKEIKLTQSQVRIRDLALRDLSGDIHLMADGSLEKASFLAVDRSIRLVATSSAQGIELNIEGRGWKPVGSLMSLDALQAKGLLKKDRLLIQNIDSTFLGGILKGTWLIDWSSGLVIAGDATLSRLDCRKVSAAFVPSLKLDGDLAGVLRLRAGGNDWESLWQSVEATFEAEVTRGVLYGIDLGEAARRGAGSMARTGSTKFDHLRAMLTINSRQITGRDVQMSAGMMTASGQFVATRAGQVDGNLNVSIKTSVSNLRLPMQVSGVLPELTAVSGK